jgi:threonine/homoserine/homoserine lactone efflux protein
MYLLYLAYESFCASGVELSESSGAPQSLVKGAMVNFLNPSPYIFWLTVGAPTIIQAGVEHPLAAIAFLGVFYLCLIGVKVMLAGLVGKSRNWFTGKPYVYLMRGLGILLAIYALSLFKDGLGLIV